MKLLVVQPNQYYRSMTPIMHQSHRYTSSVGDPRYYESVGGGGSSSSHMSYSPQSSYHQPHYPPATEHQHHSGKHSNPIETHFIPTPSEIAYTNYSSRQISMSPQSPTTPPENSFANPQQHPSRSIAPSSRNPSLRLTRISTGRPRTAPTSASPTSGASPSGERFPCDKCGKTFSRSHDRKRHHETQHMISPVIHRCRFCEKEFSRADSLKRHLDNGCEEMP
ncbi:hypothetical protein L208DRAFT_689898 [Tricholoma matsutake]|nr:hypothetical protein L208DRAFT_689898 [Tricholoma matsutake 945]